MNGSQEMYHRLVCGRVPAENDKDAVGSGMGSRALGDEGPELVGAARRDHPAETLGPHRLVAEFLAPRPEAPRRMMQRMLVGEAHSTVHLVADSRPGAGCLD